MTLPTSPPTPPAEPSDASRGRAPAWRTFLRAHPAWLGAIGIVLVAFLTVDAWLLATQRRYDAEVRRLRASMSVLERARADEIVAQEANKLRLALMLVQRQARLERSLHLSVSVDSGAMSLEREGALLRVMPVQLGPQRVVGVPPDTVTLAPPRGERSIVRVLTADDPWEVPAWVYVDRGLPVPADRAESGALGAAAIVLDGGSVIYSMPERGPLADTSYLLPGAVRARSEDLRAVLPNLTPGMRVFFY